MHIRLEEFTLAGTRPRIVYSKQTRQYDTRHQGSSKANQILIDNSLLNYIIIPDFFHLVDKHTTYIRRNARSPRSNCLESDGENGSDGAEAVADVALGGSAREQRRSRGARAGSARAGATAGGGARGSGRNTTGRGAGSSGRAGRDDGLGGRGGARAASGGLAAGGSGSGSLIASGSGSGASGVSRAGGGGGLAAIARASILVGRNTLLDGVGNTGGELVGNVFEGLWNLGADGLGEFLGSRLLLLERVENLLACVGLNGHVFLIDEGVDDIFDLVGQILDGARETKSLSGGEVVGRRGFLGAVVDGLDDIVRGLLDGVNVISALEGVDGTAERVDFVTDGGNDAGHGSQVALHEGGLTHNPSGSGEHTAGQAQGHEGERSELHFVGAITKVKCIIVLCVIENEC